MGRPRVTSDNMRGNFTKEQIEERKETEKQMESLQSITLSPPSWMDDTAKREYRRIIPLLKELPIAALDYGMVISYCVSFSELVQASKELKKADYVIETNAGTKLNQWLTVRRNAMDKINSIAPKLGMTVDSRLKIFVPKETKKERDPFDEFI